LAQANIINFPKNYQTLIAKGNDYFDAKAWTNALDCYQQAYDLQVSLSLNILMVTTLKRLGKYDQAVALAEEYLDQYLKEGHLRTYFYLVLLVDNHEFIQAQRFVDYLVETTHQQDIEKLIQLRSRRYTQQHGDFIATQIKQSFALVNDTATQAMGQIQRLKQLPLAAYLEALAIVLDNEFIHPLYKTELLSFIAPLNIDQNLNMTWFKQKRQVTLNTLPKTYQTATFLQAQTALAAAFDQDPVIGEKAMEELNLQFLLLYPFADDIVSKSTNWAQVLHESVLGLPMTDVRQKDIWDWQSRLRKLMDMLIN
jgi:tetratricopeptide (TPR) repeat protein